MTVRTWWRKTMATVVISIKLIWSEKRLSQKPYFTQRLPLRGCRERRNIIIVDQHCDVAFVATLREKINKVNFWDSLLLYKFAVIFLNNVCKYQSKFYKNDYRNMIALKSILTCPVCAFQKEETMPEDSCRFFYECEKCKTILKPKQGDCCVFCSYGSVKCQSIQTGERCRCWR